MNRTSVSACLIIILLAAPLLSCKKDGMNSAMAKKIQYRWERTSSSSTTDYLDGSAIYWTVSPAQPGTSFIQFDDNSYFYSISGSNTTKHQYKVDGDKILSLIAGNDRFTTPQYTDTAVIKYVDDHLLVLFQRKYYISGAYAYINEYIDSLKR